MHYNRLYPPPHRWPQKSLSLTHPHVNRSSIWNSVARSSLREGRNWKSNIRRSNTSVRQWSLIILMVSLGYKVWLGFAKPSPRWHSFKIANLYQRPISVLVIQILRRLLSESVAYHCTLRVLLTNTLYITSHSRTPSLLSVSAVISKQRPPLGSLLYKVTSDASIYFRQSTDQCMTDF